MPVWIQGILVARSRSAALMDDASGVATVQTELLESVDAFAAYENAAVGSYVMVVGHVRGFDDSGKAIIRAHTVRDLRSSGPLAESLWHVEVTDFFLRSYR